MLMETWRVLTAYGASDHYHWINNTGCLDVEQVHEAEDIWEAMCKAASAELTNGAETDGLAWYKKHGMRTRPISRLIWYLFPELKKQGLRFEMPYQEQLLRVGKQLGNRLHEKGIEWWNEQLKEYEALPPWKDFPGIWEQATINSGGKLEDYPFWLLTSRSMQLAWGSNSSNQMIDEVSKNMHGHRAMIMNTSRAKEMGIEEGDLVEVVVGGVAVPRVQHRVVHLVVGK